MVYLEISYYKSYHWIDKKYVKDEYVQGAINKAKVRNIVEVVEITEEEYEAGTARKKASAQAKRERNEELAKYSFVQS